MYKRIATNDTIKQIVWEEIDRLGLNANLNHIDTTQVTDMRWLFHATEFNGDISGWQVGNVTNMSYMFCNLSLFNGDISQWDVSNVTDMRSMFDSAKSFNQDIGDWDVSNVKDMEKMFYSAASFNQNIGRWAVSNVEDMEDMFAFAYSFNQDITNWQFNVNVMSKDIERLENMFLCTPLADKAKLYVGVKWNDKKTE